MADGTFTIPTTLENAAPQRDSIEVSQNQEPAPQHEAMAQQVNQAYTEIFANTPNLEKMLDLQTELFTTATDARVNIEEQRIFMTEEIYSKYMKTKSAK